MDEYYYWTKISCTWTFPLLALVPLLSTSSQHTFRVCFSILLCFLHLGLFFVHVGIFLLISLLVESLIEHMSNVWRLSEYYALSQLLWIVNRHYVWLDSRLRVLLLLGCKTGLWPAGSSNQVHFCKCEWCENEDAIKTAGSIYLQLYIMCCQRLTKKKNSQFQGCIQSGKSLQYALKLSG